MIFNLSVSDFLQRTLIKCLFDSIKLDMWFGWNVVLLDKNSNLMLFQNAWSPKELFVDWHYYYAKHSSKIESHDDLSGAHIGSLSRYLLPRRQRYFQLFFRSWMKFAFIITRKRNNVVVSFELSRCSLFCSPKWETVICWLSSHLLLFSKEKTY